MGYRGVVESEEVGSRLDPFGVVGWHVSSSRPLRHHTRHGVAVEVGDRIRRHSLRLRRIHNHPVVDRILAMVVGHILGVEVDRIGRSHRSLAVVGSRTLEDPYQAVDHNGRREVVVAEVGHHGRLDGCCHGTLLASVSELASLPNSRLGCVGRGAQCH